MKTFIIINGTTCILIEAINKEAAITRAKNMSDHSKEIIVREIDVMVGSGLIKKLQRNTNDL